jgi:hypothetical protein
VTCAVSLRSSHWAPPCGSSGRLRLVNGGERSPGVESSSPLAAWLWLRSASFAGEGGSGSRPSVVGGLDPERLAPDVAHTQLGSWASRHLPEPAGMNVRSLIQTGSTISSAGSGNSVGSFSPELPTYSMPPR